MSPMFERGEAGTVWRHRMSGHLYVIVGRCQIEATWEPGILYRRLNNPEPAQHSGPIARSASEFFDGRFEAVRLQGDN
jgi:hypothetical protein